MTVKIKFVLFVLEQVKELWKHSRMIYTPWKWGKINMERYVMNVLFSVVMLTVFCAFVHGTFNPLECFGLNFSNKDPGNCYLRDETTVGVSDGTYTTSFRGGAYATCRDTLVGHGVHH